VLTASDFDGIPALFQFRFQHLALVALDFDSIFLDRATHAAFLLQFLGQLFQLSAGQGQAPHQGDSLAAAALGFAMQPDDAIPGGGGPVLAADTVGDRALALGTAPASICGINQPAVGSCSLCHGLSYYLRVIQEWRQYIRPPPEREPGMLNVMKEAAQLMELQQQVAELQAQVAFQEDTIQSLDQALAGQQQEILLLRRQIELLKQRQDEMAAAPGGQPGDAASEKPPHY